jgi:hypothetical protein
MLFLPPNQCSMLQGCSGRALLRHRSTRRRLVVSAELFLFCLCFQNLRSAARASVRSFLINIYSCIHKLRWSSERRRPQWQARRTLFFSGNCRECKATGTAFSSFSAHIFLIYYGLSYAIGKIVNVHAEYPEPA